MINSRPNLSTSPKVEHPNSKYKPLEMSDESVYELARHYFTAAEIAERFCTTKETVMKVHGEAFNLGKANAMQKPRMLLNKIFDDFMGEDLNFARSDVPTGTLLKAIELHAKKYENLGQKIIIESSDKTKYDAVTSAPEIIEKPE